MRDILSNKGVKLLENYSKKYEGEVNNRTVTSLLGIILDAEDKTDSMYELDGKIKDKVRLNMEVALNHYYDSDTKVTEETPIEGIILSEMVLNICMNLGIKHNSYKLEENRVARMGVFDKSINDLYVQDFIERIENGFELPILDSQDLYNLKAVLRAGEIYFIDEDKPVCYSILRSIISDSISSIMLMDGASLNEHFASFIRLARRQRNQTKDDKEMATNRLYNRVYVIESMLNGLADIKDQLDVIPYEEKDLYFGNIQVDKVILGVNYREDKSLEYMENFCFNLMDIYLS